MVKVEEESLGCYLKREREARGITADQLSKRAGISEALIRSIEDDRFPQPEYILGYLKLYSNHLDLDHQEVLRRADQTAARLQHLRADHPTTPEFRFNSPLLTARNTGMGSFHHPDRMVKQIVFFFFFVLVASILFFIPSEYKGPKAMRPPDLNSPHAAGVGSAPITLPPVEPGTAVPPATATAPVTPAVSDATSTPGVTNAPAVGAASAVAVKPAPVLENKLVRVVGNQDSKRYHLPGMRYYDQVQAHHRVIFNSEDEAIEAGYHKAPR
ncbi:MAG: hypothetical protein CSYNP_03368 [Syntrophus sp. SKADARSKE-3]|nr:hypothetical protein [Syntrophus sp. SKADARSKE-3]